MRLFCAKDGRDKYSYIADAQLHVARSIEKCLLPFCSQRQWFAGCEHVLACVLLE